MTIYKITHRASGTVTLDPELKTTDQDFLKRHSGVELSQEDFIRDMHAPTLQAQLGFTLEEVDTLDAVVQAVVDKKAAQEAVARYTTQFREFLLSGLKSGQKVGEFAEHVQLHFPSLEKWCADSGLFEGEELRRIHRECQEWLDDAPKRAKEKKLVNHLMKGKKQ